MLFFDNRDREVIFLLDDKKKELEIGSWTMICRYHHAGVKLNKWFNKGLEFRSSAYNLECIE